MRTLAIEDLGLASYREAWARQLVEVDRRKPAPDGSFPDLNDLVLLVEHPHVITVGRRSEALRNVVAPGDVEVVAIERGGDVTYHGPGQLVAYPIVQLALGERDLHRFLRNLEEAVIRTLARWSIDAGRAPGATGVWLPGARTQIAAAAAGSDKKICSMGIACRRWVTFHGLALNVTTDLSYFHRINPCGFEAGVMTSMAEVLGAGVDMADVKAALAAELAAALGRQRA